MQETKSEQIHIKIEYKDTNVDFERSKSFT